MHNRPQQHQRGGGGGGKSRGMWPPSSPSPSPSSSSSSLCSFSTMCVARLLFIVALLTFVSSAVYTLREENSTTINTAATTTTAHEQQQQQRGDQSSANHIEKLDEEDSRGKAHDGDRYSYTTDGKKPHQTPKAYRRSSSSLPSSSLSSPSSLVPLIAFDSYAESELTEVQKPLLSWGWWGPKQQQHHSSVVGGDRGVSSSIGSGTSSSSGSIDGGGGGVGWTVAMLSHAEAYFNRVYFGGGGIKGGGGLSSLFSNGARVKLAETVERCTRGMLEEEAEEVGEDGDRPAAVKGRGENTATKMTKKTFRRFLRHSLKHPLCVDAIEKYKALPPPDSLSSSSSIPSSSSSSSSLLPPSLLTDLAANEGYCLHMRSYVWSVLVPRLPPSLQEALRSQYDRQMAVMNEARLRSGKRGGSLSSSKLHPQKQQEGKEEEEQQQQQHITKHRFLVWSLSGGLGNRFQSLTSTLLAAMLSGRVLLVKDWFTVLPPNVKGAKPTIYSSKRTSEYALEPLQKLFNVADDAYFSGETHDEGDGDGSSDEAFFEDLLFEFSTQNNNKNNLNSSSSSPSVARWHSKLSKKSKHNSNGGGSRRPPTAANKAAAGWNGGEQLRPPNSMLLCSIFPLMSLSEYRRLFPEAFAAAETTNADKEEGPNKVSVNKNTNTLPISSFPLPPSPLPPAAFREDHVKIDISARHDKKLVRWERFACGVGRKKKKGEEDSSGGRNSADGVGGEGETSVDDDALFFSERFVYVWTNQYYAPLFFSNPHTTERMLSWFPPSASSSSTASYTPEGPYNVLSKLVVIPSSHVMRRVIGFLGGEGDQQTSPLIQRKKEEAAGRRAQTASTPPRLVPGQFVSMQIRAFSTDSFGALAAGFDTCYQSILKEISSSAVRSPSSRRGSAPDNDADNGDASSSFSSSLPPPFFLASLHAPVRDYFVTHYGAPNVVTLTPPTHEQGTGKDYRLDLDALADMFLLSVSGVLLVSPGSTFGAFVAAFADHVPIRVDYHRGGGGGGGGGGDGEESSLVVPSSSSSSNSTTISQSRLPPTCRIALSQQPCFGSWFRYDKLWHRRGELMSMAGRSSGVGGEETRKKMPRGCELLPMAPHGHRCEV